MDTMVESSMAEDLPPIEPHPPSKDTAEPAEDRCESNVADVEMQDADLARVTETPPKVSTPTMSATTDKTPSDDIIILDEEEEDNNAKQEKPQSPPAEVLETEEVPTEDSRVTTTPEKEVTKAKIDEIKTMVKSLSRRDLEEIVINRVIESVNSYSNVGELRTKYLQLHATKDKLFQKSVSLQKQVNELTKAVRQLTENVNRNPKTAPKGIQPLRFFRSVGLQVGMDVPRPAGRLQVKQETKPIIKPQTKFNPGPARNGMVNGIGGNKRPYGNTSPINKTTPPNILAHRTNNSIPTSSFPPTAIPATIKANENRENNGVADIAAKISSGQGQLVYGPNGQLQLRVLDNSSGVQLSPQGSIKNLPAGFQIVTTQNQSSPGGLPNTRPTSIIVTQGMHLGQQLGGGGQVVYRGRSPTQPIQPKPTQITITNAVRNPVFSQTASNMNQNRIAKFTLPPLPIASNNPVNPNAGAIGRRGSRELPPKPELTLKEENEGIVLSWNLKSTASNAEINTYQLYACQEPLQSKTNVLPQWKRVGDVKALPLPMACTLSQFTDENRYHFIVRAIDVYNRSGAFCDPKSIVLKKKTLT